jgi:hypothetical protein
LVVEEARCGICGDAENAEALSENVRRFIGMDKKTMGQNARIFYNEHFEKQRLMDEMEEYFGK